MAKIKDDMRQDEETTDWSERDINEAADIDKIDVDEDEEFLPRVTIVDYNDKQKRRIQLDSLTTALGIERVPYQLSSKISELSPVSLDHFRRLHQDMQKQLTERFYYLAAPGQEKEMKDMLTSEERTVPEPPVAHLKEAFDTCETSQTRRAVLMLVPKTYSKKRVTEIFECSLYEKKRDFTLD